jgi:hypothetical protein
MPSTLLELFLTLPRELRDEIYDLLWLDTPNIAMQDYNDVKQISFFSTTEKFPPTTIYERTGAKMPAWPRTNAQIWAESKEAFLRRSVLCIAPFPNMGWGRSPTFLHSRLVHNTPPGAYLSLVQNIELTLPIFNLRCQHDDDIHVASHQCCMLALARLIGTAGCLKSLKISLNGCGSYREKNAYIVLTGLRYFWEATANLDRFEIFIDGRFVYWEAAANFHKSVEDNFRTLRIDIPALKLDVNYKMGASWYELECSLVYKK